MELQWDEEIGRGAFAQLWRARDNLGREVAVKFIDGDEPEQVERLALEHAQALVRVNHPAVVRVHSVEKVTHPDAGGERMAIVMEYVDGPSLNKFTGEISRSLAAQHVEDLANGLSAIHEVGLIHGDLHEGNVILGSGGARLIDILYTRSLASVATTTANREKSDDIRELARVCRCILGLCPDVEARALEEAYFLACAADSPQTVAKHFRNPLKAEHPTDVADEQGVSATVSTRPTADTNPIERLARDLEDGKRSARFVATRLLGELGTSLKELRAKPDSDTPLDEKVFAAIAKGVSTRNEYVSLLDVLCTRAEAELIEELLVPFLESLLQMREHSGPGSWMDAEYDAIRFLTYEIFLYTIVLLIVRGHPKVAATVVREKYIFERNGLKEPRDSSSFYAYVESIESNRKSRLKLDRASLVADLLKERADQAGVSFERIQLVDFLMYVRAHLEAGHWYPRTLVYIGFHPEPFDVFLLPNSKRHFAWLTALLNVNSVDELDKKLKATFANSGASKLTLGSWPFDIRPLMNLPTS